MKRFAILLPGVAILAACSGAAGNNAAATTNAAAPAADATAPADVAVAAAGASIQPGQYEVRATLEEFDMPGAPPAALEQMKQTVAGQVQRVCYTPEDAANMGRRLIETNNQGTNCQFTNQEFGNGRINTSGTCTGAQGNVEMSMQGTYTPTSIETRNTVTTSAAGQTIRMVVTSNSQRVGDCPAGGAASETK